jgi:hypothetical protein
LSGRAVFQEAFVPIGYMKRCEEFGDKRQTIVGVPVCRLTMFKSPSTIGMRQETHNMYSSGDRIVVLVTVYSEISPYRRRDG